MPRNGFGTLVLPAGNPAVAGDLITAAFWNSTIEDLAQGVSDSIPVDGQRTPTANLPMGGYRHTGCGNAVADTDYTTLGQVKALIFQGVTVYTSGSGTFTKKANTVVARVRAVGGGGAGGGASLTSGSQVSFGEGGGAGGYAEVWIVPGATESYSVGAGGSGVSGSTGNSGGNTTFGSWLTCNGGGGGAVSLGLTTQVFGVAGITGGTASGSGGTGIFNRGADGIPGFYLGSGIGISTGGAQTVYGGGGSQVVGTLSSAGQSAPASNYGAGGGGAVNYSSQTAKAGGNGAGGVLIIEEFG